ncbi:MAG: hypothetical protein AB1512_20325 [Thermodesulfobacteriota bacterium]
MGTRRLKNYNMDKTKIKRDLLGRFGPYALRDLEIASHGSRPNTRYGITLDKGKIEIVYRLGRRPCLWLRMTVLCMWRAPTFPSPPGLGAGAL